MRVSTAIAGRGSVADYDIPGGPYVVPGGLQCFGSRLLATCGICKKRREGDSNPRTSFPVTRFPVVPVQPLRHLSEWTPASVAAASRPRAPGSADRAGSGRHQRNRVFVLCRRRYNAKSTFGRFAPSGRAAAPGTCRAPRGLRRGRGNQICQAPSRSSGISVRSARTPVTATSLDPTMKSTWIALLFTRSRSGPCSTVNG
jgi:hypothetical protein